MRGFVKALNNNNLTTEIDYSSYISLDDLNTKWSLKWKLSEKLELEWIELPNQASSKYINENCENEWKKSSSKNLNKWENVSNNAKIKNQYKAKYNQAFSKLSDDKLNELINKIDDLSYKINNSDYTLSLKEKYNSILLALKELAIENLD